MITTVPAGRGRDGSLARAVTTVLRAGGCGGSARLARRAEPAARTRAAWDADGDGRVVE